MAQLYDRIITFYSPEKQHVHDLVTLQLLAEQHGIGYQLVSQTRARNWQNWGRVTLYSCVKLTGDRRLLTAFVSGLSFR